ncbi:MAG: hypothetical protein ABIO55_16710 [Ginsengibacter sp.]
MGGFHVFSVLKDPIIQEDSLHITQVKAGKKIRSAQLKGILNVYRYRDKDTRQIVAYLPSLEISGYGADEKKANEMLQFSLGEYFEYLGSLQPKKLHAELAQLKWKQNPLKHKDYSIGVENVKGQLEALNAVGNKIERLTLQAK